MVRRLIFHNLPLKLLALSSAILLWSAVGREPRAEVAHTVPIEFVNVPAGMTINSDKIPQTQVWLSGPVRLVRSVEAQDLHPVIDLTGLRHSPGERTYTLQTSQIKAPHGVEIVAVVPSEFHLQLDLLSTRKIAVLPRLRGQLPAGFRISEISTEPPVVSVQGPESRVRAIEQATTDPLDLTGVRGRQVYTMTPYVNDPLVRVMEPSVVHITIRTTDQTSAGGPS